MEKLPNIRTKNNIENQKSMDSDLICYQKVIFSAFI